MNHPMWVLFMASFLFMPLQYGQSAQGYCGNKVQTTLRVGDERLNATWQQRDESLQPQTNGSDTSMSVQDTTNVVEPQKNDVSVGQQGK